jgi:hypothetical protein
MLWDVLVEQKFIARFSAPVVAKETFLIPAKQSVYTQGRLRKIKRK